MKFIKNVPKLWPSDIVFEATWTYFKLRLYAQVIHSRIERQISHGYNPASFLAICIGS